ncbi:hypothetical protein NSK_002256 [Nannochloropsis salina CCMP1776]|uniref:Uncharacterized protein n=1 Tax=Nannochloropsis salina CCMP1776 TaxID=1027361 RepID=A0A4D9DDD8_9STRA|nr:hypothetical protein NSK_002256 [Nannochloropsis salina CCMP1776]|eukprot:TFJ86599.1 hypothetical protein NSK_002256 [Nannochloropsis salina CCMP1776]
MATDVPGTAATEEPAVLTDNEVAPVVPTPAVKPSETENLAPASILPLPEEETSESAENGQPPAMMPSPLMPEAADNSSSVPLPATVESTPAPSVNSSLPHPLSSESGPVDGGKGTSETHTTGLSSRGSFPLQLGVAPSGNASAAPSTVDAASNGSHAVVGGSQGLNETVAHALNGTASHQSNNSQAQSSTDSVTHPLSLNGTGAVNGSAAHMPSGNATSGEVSVQGSGLDGAVSSNGSPASGHASLNATDIANGTSSSVPLNTTGAVGINATLPGGPAGAPEVPPLAPSLNGTLPVASTNDTSGVSALAPSSQGVSEGVEVAERDPEAAEEDAADVGKDGESGQNEDTSAALATNETIPAVATAQSSIETGPTILSTPAPTLTEISEGDPMATGGEGVVEIGAGASGQALPIATPTNMPPAPPAITSAPPVTTNATGLPPPAAANATLPPTVPATLTNPEAPSAGDAIASPPVADGPPVIPTPAPLDASLPTLSPAAPLPTAVPAVVVTPPPTLPATLPPPATSTQPAAVTATAAPSTVPSTAPVTGVPAAPTSLPPTLPPAPVSTPAATLSPASPVGTITPTLAPVDVSEPGSVASPTDMPTLPAATLPPAVPLGTAAPTLPPAAPSVTSTGTLSTAAPTVPAATLPPAVPLGTAAPTLPPAAPSVTSTGTLSTAAPTVPAATLPTSVGTPATASVTAINTTLAPATAPSLPIQPPTQPAAGAVTNTPGQPSEGPKDVVETRSPTLPPTSTVPISSPLDEDAPLDEDEHTNAPPIGAADIVPIPSANVPISTSAEAPEPDFPSPGLVTPPTLPPSLPAVTPAIPLPTEAPPQKHGNLRARLGLW